MTAYEDLLKSAWEGELLGEAFFAAVAEVQPDDAEMWRSLAELERVVGALVRSVAEPLGISVDIGPIVEGARGYLSQTRTMTREAIIDGTLAYLPGACASYEALARVASEDARWLTDALLAHERALGADLQRARDGGVPCTEHVTAFLASTADAARS